MTTATHNLHPYQLFSAARPYRIAAATYSLNTLLPEIPTPSADPLRPTFHFLARSWPPTPSTSPGATEPPPTSLFNFTYFSVPHFHHEKAHQIHSALRADPKSWRALLQYVEDIPHIRETREFLSSLLRPDDTHCPDPTTLHYHFTVLLSAIAVDGLMPGALWRVHYAGFRSSNGPRAYFVTTTTTEGTSSEGISLPDLQIQHLLPSSRPPLPLVPQQPPRSLSSPPARHAYIELTLWLTDYHKAHATSSGSSATIPTSHTLWLPVYEEYREERFFGRFLGWLFCPIDNPVNLDTDQSRKALHEILSITNQFSMNFVQIETGAMLQSLLKSPPPKNDRQPGVLLERLLPRWEGWAKASHHVEKPSTWPQDYKWWRNTNRELHICLHPPARDDTPLWGGFSNDDFGYIVLESHESTVPWPLDEGWRPYNGATSDVTLRQAQRIRDVARQLASTLHGISSAEAQEGALQHGNWAHEVKNSALIAARLLDGNRHDFDHVQAAHHYLRILAATSYLIQQLGPGGGGRRYTPDAAYPSAVRRALEFLLYVQALFLHLDTSTDARLFYSPLESGLHPDAMPESPHPGPAPNFSFLDRLDSAEMYAIALLREVVGNIRNEYPAFSRPDIDVAYRVITRSEGAVTVELTQESHQSRPPDDVSATKKSGIDRTNQLFAAIGQIHEEHPRVTQISIRDFHIVRAYRIEWEGPQK